MAAVDVVATIIKEKVVRRHAEAASVSRVSRNVEQGGMDKQVLLHTAGQTPPAVSSIVNQPGLLGSTSRSTGDTAPIAPRRSCFRQADLTRAVRGATKAGVCVARIEIDPNGKITILSDRARSLEPTNEWDEVLR